MHSIRCTRILQQQQRQDIVKEHTSEVNSSNDQPSTSGSTKKKKSKTKIKKKESNNGIKNKTNKNQSSSGSTESDDIDSILDEFKKLNNSCGYTVDKCKNSIKTLGQKCEFCGLIFCLTHHMAEVHGCGDAVRIKARRDQAKYAVGGASSCSKPKPMKSGAKAHVQRKLDKKLDELQTDRKKKNKKK